MKSDDNGHTGVTLGLAGGREGTPQGRRKGREPDGHRKNDHGRGLLGGQRRARANPLIDRRWP